MNTMSPRFLAFAALLAFLSPAAIAADAATLTSQAQTALNSLYAGKPGAASLGKKAVAVLVFPSITKAGLGIGGQFGEGVLFRGGKPAGFYNTAGASFGL